VRKFFATAVLAISLTACGTPANQPATVPPAVASTAQATPTTDPGDAGIDETPTAAPKSTLVPQETVYGINEAEDVTTVIVVTSDLISCGELPVSMIYVEDQDGDDAQPYGDISLGDNNSTTVVLAVHFVKPNQKYRLNIGCGYRKSGDNDTLYEFNLPAVFEPVSPGERAIVCSTKNCTVDGKPIS
jgi:hypothetical protein